MTKTLHDDLPQTVIPEQRKARRPEIDLQARIEGEARAYHHLMDINLQVFDSVTDAAIRILRRARGRAVGTSVFTCNVDHLMLMNKEQRFRDAYERADVVTIDGAPLALLTKLTGTAEARRVTGVALTGALVEQAERDGLRIALVGGAPGRGVMAAANLRREHSELGEVFVDSPRMGFEIGDEEDQRLVSGLVAFQPDVVIVCLGAPKQELWIDQHRNELPGAVLVGAGATIDFLSGYQTRAPRFFQATGTEAAYRLATDFRRLWRRYLLRDSKFFVLFAGLTLGYAAGRARVGSSARSHGATRRRTSAARPSPCRACGYSPAA
ncbi:WecB/TagA/CpsF family glycosyltransferase [Actinomycetospora sp. OC33-EN08]|uniref:WecB/TagA/CpsF family glycosyltransferase n=1 Tax=Actinomycetospora aurantiaca TaxID=3129233 RepID=A0ABU8MID1_9PSEU